MHSCVVLLASCAHVRTLLHHLHLPLNRRWGTTGDFTTSVHHFSLFSTALWDLANSRPVHSLLLSSRLFLSARSFFPFHCALQDSFLPDLMRGDMTLPLQFASLYDGHDVSVWFYCLLDLGADFLVGNVVFE